MKILHLTRHLDIGGIPRYVVDLSARHAAMGHTVFVASSGGLQEAALQAAGIRHLRIPLSSKFEFGSNLWASWAALMPVLRQEHFDVVHAHTRIAQVLAGMISRVHGIPAVTTCHGFFKPNLGRKIWPCWGGKVIAVSPAVREHLIGVHGVPKQRIVCIPNGIDKARFVLSDGPTQDALREKLGIPPNARVVGTVARLSPVKGLEYLIEAMELSIAQHPSLHCLIVGDGPDKEKLRELAACLGLERRVFFAGAVLDVAPYLGLMDIFVLPSVMEGLGLSILEAFAAGKPVVASRVGGIPDVVQDGHNGLLVPPENARDLATAVERLLDDRPLAKELAQAGQRTLEQSFSLAGMAEEIQRVYQNF